MTKEMKVRNLIDAYSDQAAMLDSKYRLDREAAMERSDRYSNTELTQTILAINMEYAQVLNEKRNKVIQAIFKVMEGE